MRVVPLCALECGREGSLYLFDGELRVCFPCAVKAAEKVIVQRELKGISKARKQGHIDANRISGGRIRPQREIKLAP